MQPLSVSLFPDVDMVAVPDFGAGAMENWGLIIYRETALLYNPEENSASNKQRVAVVVSHELAHQVCITKQSVSNFANYQPFSM